MGFPKPRHNHQRCVRTALQNAESMSLARGLRMTATRRRVLEILWQSHNPLGAYDILERLQESEERRPAPMAVYRALDFLIEAGLAHRLSSLNAFIGCSTPDNDHQAQFLICDQCGSAAEIEEQPIAEAVEQAATSVGFQVHQGVVEISGVCPNCQP